MKASMAGCLSVRCTKDNPWQSVAQRVQTNTWHCLTLFTMIKNTHNMFKGQCLTLFLKKMATIENTDKTNSKQQHLLVNEDCCHQLPFCHSSSLPFWPPASYPEGIKPVGNTVNNCWECGQWFKTSVSQQKTVRKFCWQQLSVMEPVPHN